MRDWLRAALFIRTGSRAPSPPPIGETLISLFTPAKFRETVLVEMQEAYERTLVRHGRWIAGAAYWIEIVRNTTAFMGWKVPAAIGGIIAAGSAFHRAVT